MLRGLRQTLKDAYRCGPAFAAAGLRQARGTGLVAWRSDGHRLVARRGMSDFETFRQVFRNRDYDLDAAYERRVMDRYRAIVAAGQCPVIVDAGANVGAATLWLARKYPEARLLAVEPEPDNARILRENVGGLRRVTIVEAAIGSAGGFVSVTGDHSGWAARTERSAAGVAVVTIPDLVASVPGGTLFAVKVDIEGFEDDLFAAETGWLDALEVLWVEPHDWLFPDRRTSGNLQREMGRREFALLIRGENLTYVRHRK
ncbi:MAG TPA: FkbM family methyltransferase [Croceibacterium sp.]|nr:FkbM family methyltransferase [Croceibacterium sp.]